MRSISNIYELKVETCEVWISNHVQADGLISLARDNQKSFDVASKTQKMEQSSYIFPSRPPFINFGLGFIGLRKEA